MEEEQVFLPLLTAEKVWPAHWGLFLFTVVQVGEADGNGNLVKKKSVITLMQHV